MARWTPRPPLLPTALLPDAPGAHAHTAGWSAELALPVAAAAAATASTDVSRHVALPTPLPAPGSTSGGSTDPATAAAAPPPALVATLQTFTSLLALLCHESVSSSVATGGGSPFLWEAITPLPHLTSSYTPRGEAAAPGAPKPTPLPVYYFAVTVFWAGAWRRVVVDDRMPYLRVADAYLPAFPVTADARELWPALLWKAWLVLTCCPPAAAAVSPPPDTAHAGAGAGAAAAPGAAALTDAPRPSSRGGGRAGASPAAAASTPVPPAPAAAVAAQQPAVAPSSHDTTTAPMAPLAVNPLAALLRATTDAPLLPDVADAALMLYTFAAFLPVSTLAPTLPAGASALSNLLAAATSPAAVTPAEAVREWSLARELALVQWARDVELAEVARKRAMAAERRRRLEVGDFGAASLSAAGTAGGPPGGGVSASAITAAITASLADPLLAAAIGPHPPALIPPVFPPPLPSTQLSLPGAAAAPATAPPLLLFARCAVPHGTSSGAPHADPLPVAPASLTAAASALAPVATLGAASDSGTQHLVAGDSYALLLARRPHPAPTGGAPAVRVRVTAPPLPPADDALAASATSGGVALEVGPDAIVATGVASSDADDDFGIGIAGDTPAPSRGGPAAAAAPPSPAASAEWMVLVVGRRVRLEGDGGWVPAGTATAGVLARHATVAADATLARQGMELARARDALTAANAAAAAAVAAAAGGSGGAASATAGGAGGGGSLAADLVAALLASDDAAPPPGGGDGVDGAGAALPPAAKAALAHALAAASDPHLAPLLPDDRVAAAAAVLARDPLLPSRGARRGGAGGVEESKEGKDAEGSEGAVKWVDPVLEDDCWLPLSALGAFFPEVAVFANPAAATLPVTSTAAATPAPAPSPLPDGSARPAASVAGLHRHWLQTWAGQRELDERALGDALGGGGGGGSADGGGLLWNRASSASLLSAASQLARIGSAGRARGAAAADDAPGTSGSAPASAGGASGEPASSVDPKGGKRPDAAAAGKPAAVKAQRLPPRLPLGLRRPLLHPPPQSCRR